MPDDGSTPAQGTDPDSDQLVSRLRAAGSVFAEEEAELLRAAAATPAHLAALVERRTGGTPLQHLVGWAEFCGIRVALSPEVFIPRARTELLVRQAVALVEGREATVVDVCCGCGALGAAIVALAAAGDRIALHAVDIDPVALECARENLAPLRGQVHHGDLCAPLPGHLRGRVDVLVANVPYVPTPAIPGQMFGRYEPRAALDGGDDGLDVLRRLAAQAPRWVAPGGHLLVETSLGQSPAAGEVMDRAGLTPRVVRDEQLDATAVIGRRR